MIESCFGFSLQAVKLQHFGQSTKHTETERELGKKKKGEEGRRRRRKKKKGRRLWCLFSFSFLRRHSLPRRLWRFLPVHPSLSSVLHVRSSSTRSNARFGDFPQQKGWQWMISPWNRGDLPLPSMPFSESV